MSRKGRAPRPEQEGFGEAELGEAQSSNPPPDPEMLDGERPPEQREREDERAEAEPEDAETE